MIEKDVLDIAHQGAVINLPNEMIENLYRVFLKSKEKGREHLSFVLREGYLVNILEDSYFEAKLDNIVRLSVDNEAETLDNIMERINTTHTPETLEWEPFLSFFCRRGMLRDTEKMIFQF